MEKRKQRSRAAGTLLRGRTKPEETPEECTAVSQPEETPDLQILQDLSREPFSYRCLAPKTKNTELDPNMGPKGMGLFTAI